MGKIPLWESTKSYNHSKDCENQDAPLCGNKSCSKQRPIEAKGQQYNDVVTLVDSLNKQEPSNCLLKPPVQELLVVGAGPHALTLLLRLLEPDPDLLTDKVRHARAINTKKMRPMREVHRHIKDIAQGPSVTLKPRKRKGRSKKKLATLPPPLTLDMILHKSTVIDLSGSCWLGSWKAKFDAIDISQLRSLMNAHCDPFDHRSLEYFAEAKGRGNELITLKDLAQNDKLFTGPYQVPSTSLFHDFHDALSQAYGIKDIVQQGAVRSIIPLKDGDSDEGIFEVEVSNHEGIARSIRTKRCVFCMGPRFNDCEHSWETYLREEEGDNYDNISKRILRSDGIVRWLSDHKNEASQEKKFRILIVGGGITSAQLAIRAINSHWCKSVIFIQRSQSLLRHFDVTNEWMGPKRGKILDQFYSMDMIDRAALLKSARKGGSLPPELHKEIKMIEKKNRNFICKEGVEISHVDWDAMNEEFHVSLDDELSQMMPIQVDYIWLATGCSNVITKYPVLEKLHEILPIDVVNGLPVLSEDLSWGGIKEDGIDDEECNHKHCLEAKKNAKEKIEECKWKQNARKRIWCMGSLAGLQLGADALNIVGARHGAVKVAKSIRADMMTDFNTNQPTEP